MFFVILTYWHRGVHSIKSRKSVFHFSKKLHLKYMTGFWICLCLQKKKRFNLSILITAHPHAQYWNSIPAQYRKSKTVSLFRKIRGLSRTMSNICDGVFCKNILQLKTFFAKIFIIYVWQGPKKVSDYPTKKNSSTAWKGSIFGVSVVRIFPQSNWIWRDTPYISVFSPIARKYVPEKLRIQKLSTQSSLLDRDINRCRQ